MSATPCPTEQQLAALVDGDLAGPERDAVASHVDQCSSCLDAVATLARLADEPQPALDDGLRTRVLAPGRSRPWLRALPALSAAAVLVLAVAWWQGRPPSSTLPVAPATESEIVRGNGPPAIVLEEPEEGASVDSGFRLRWSGPPGVAFFEIQVTTTGGDLLWTRQVGGTTREAYVQLEVSQDRHVYVWVSALLGEGRRINSNVVRVHARQQD